MEPCLHCGLATSLLHDDVRDYEYGVPWKSALVICRACGLVAQSPRVTPEDIAGLYPRNYHAYTGGKHASGLYWQLRKALSRMSLRGLLEHLPPGGRLLEVGSGNGSFLQLVADTRPDLALHGVDIEDTGTHDGTFQFHRGQLESVSLPSSHFDAIYFSNLIEHVPDPKLFLTTCRRLLKRGGVVYGNTPDHLSLDRMLFGKYWAGYHYPRHTFVFDHHNFPALLRKCGYDKVRVSGGYAFWSLSLRNLLMEGHGGQKRGLAHAGTTLAMLPLDLLINLARCHGAMTFVATAA